jgi:hypothetical protein
MFSRFRKKPTVSNIIASPRVTISYGYVDSIRPNQEVSKEPDWGIGSRMTIGGVVIEKPVEKKEFKYPEPEANITTVSVVSIRNNAMGHLATVFPDPTGNCQIQSISNFHNILDIKDRNDCLKYLATAWDKSSRKTELLIDIDQKYEKIMLELFMPEEILVQANYKNNTNSLMCIWLVQIKYMLERNNLV